MSLPLHQQIRLPQEEVEQELLEVISRKTLNKDIPKITAQTEKEVNAKMLELLNVKVGKLDIIEKPESLSEAANPLIKDDVCGTTIGETLVSPSQGGCR